MENNKINEEREQMTGESKKEQTMAKASKGIAWSIWTLSIISIMIIVGILVTQLLYDNGGISSSKFYDNTSINGIDVSGMDKNEAASLISAKLLNAKDEISIKLMYGEKEWNLTGSDFETNGDVSSEVDQAFRQGRTGSMSEKIFEVRQIKQKGLAKNISYRSVLKNFDEKVDNIIEEINKAPTNPHVQFDVNTDPMFSVAEGIKGIEVDKDLLYKMIDEAFSISKNIAIEIPVNETDFEAISSDEILENVKLRSNFSTGYASSQDGRKNNVKRALADFNGMTIQPGEEVSFNNVTGDKTAEKGYQKAKIILNGVYVEGYGGGACQASTTLYNALLLADIEILEVNPHSMPVSYVPLAFDAMVSEGYSDLIFRNNLECPIFIKTWGDEERAYVEIYGQSLGEGIEIKRRAEFMGVIPHEGDMVVKDVNGEYTDKITYAGEYLRIKNPQEGYHSKAYIQYYKDGTLQDEKLIRDEIYKPQKGIVMEGTETLGEGMIIPENEVKIIPPQLQASVNENSVNKKIGEQSPSNYNP